MQSVSTGYIRSALCVCRMCVFFALLFGRYFDETVQTACCSWCCELVFVVCVTSNLCWDRHAVVVFPTRTFTFCKYRLVLRVLQVCDSLLSTDVGASTSLRSFCCISTDIFLIYSALVQIAAVFVKIFFLTSRLWSWQQRTIFCLQARHFEAPCEMMTVTWYCFLCFKLLKYGDVSLDLVLQAKVSIFVLGLVLDISDFGLTLVPVALAFAWPYISKHSSF